MHKQVQRPAKTEINSYHHGQRALASSFTVRMLFLQPAADCLSYLFPRVISDVGMMLCHLVPTPFSANLHYFDSPLCVWRPCITLPYTMKCKIIRNVNVNNYKLFVV